MAKRSNSRKTWAFRMAKKLRSRSRTFQQITSGEKDCGDVPAPWPRIGARKTTAFWKRSTGTGSVKLARKSRNEFPPGHRPLFRSLEKAFRLNASRSEEHTSELQS